jgi:hypothetical protein
MLPSLATLIAVVTPANALSNILSIAQGLGLSTTAWQPLGMARTIFTTMSQVVAAATGNVNLIAQGGYATTAAQMVDTNGLPITTWMDLVSLENYGNRRNPAVAAEGSVTFSNITNVYHGPFPAGTFHLTNPITGATYTNTFGFAIDGTSSPPTPVSITANFAADTPGAGGTAFEGLVLVMATPIPGVSVQPLAADMVGTDAETNNALLLRDIAKLGALSDNGAQGALIYVATTPNIIAGYGVVSAPITRAFGQLNTGTGTVTLYVANSDGAATGPDCAIVQAAEQAIAVPTGMTVVVAPSGEQSINVNATIFVTGPTAGISTIAEEAILAYFATVPINGVNGEDEGILPYSGVLAALQTSSQFITSIDMTEPAGDTDMTIGSVPILGGASIVVEQVPAS